MKSFISATLAATLALGGTTPVFAGEHKDPSKVMGESGVKLLAELTGEAEVPGPGDKDGSGMFKAQLIPSSGQMCYEVLVDDIDDVTGAHIHFGAEGVAGDVAVALKDLDDGKVSDCLTMDSALAVRILQDPSQFYVNVHDTEHPAGALRGQLMK
jgi:hypothetical protein